VAEPPKQIPWAKQVKVTWSSDMSIELERGDTKLDIQKDGTWWGSIDSRKRIFEWMELDKKLTRQIKDDFDTHYDGGGFIEFMGNWVRGKLPGGKAPEGPKEWMPTRTRKRIGKLFGPDRGGYGSENTYNWDNAYFWGDTFEYVHFLSVDDEEGAVVMWHIGGDVRGNYAAPEVWMGSFGEFMGSQDEGDPKSADTFLTYNGMFENGIVWALFELELFDGEQEIPDQVVRAIKEYPKILYPQLVEQIVENRDLLPIEIVNAAGTVLDQERRATEKAAGQKYLWKPLKP
jgi:hypothetical protein